MFFPLIYLLQSNRTKLNLLSQTWSVKKRLQMSLNQWVVSVRAASVLDYTVLVFRLTEDAVQPVDALTVLTQMSIRK